MISVTSLLWVWKGESTAGRWFFLTVPEDQSTEIRAEALSYRRGFGSVRVQATIDDPSPGSGQAVTWRTSVFPLNKGGYVLPVKAEVRRRAKLAAGDEVTVRLDLL